MATLKIKQNGIVYSIKDDIMFMYGPGKMTHSSNVNGTDQYNINKINSKGNTTPAFNAIDIDWNGAEVERHFVLNNTSDLINWIKSKFGALGNITEEVQEEYYTAEDEEVINGEKEIGEIKVEGSIEIPHTVETFVNKKISELIDSAPEELNTLKEISDALKDNNDTIGAIVLSISDKANKEDIPTIPTKISEFENDVNYTTKDYVDEHISDNLGSFGKIIITEGKEAVYYTPQEIIEHNNELGGEWEYGKEKQSEITQQDADEYNSNLDSAIQAGDDKVYTSEEANQINSNLDNQKVQAGDLSGGIYTYEEAVLYNRELNGYIAPNVPLTDIQVMDIRIGVNIKKQVGDVLTQEEADLYASTLNGAVTEGDEKRYSPSQAEQFNNNLDSQKVNEGDPTGEHYSLEEANAHNATLEGAIFPSEAIIYTNDEVDAHNELLWDANTIKEPAIEEVSHDANAKEYIDLKIAQLIDDAPSALDTLKEIADALNKDVSGSVANALVASIASKANSNEVYTKNEIDEKNTAIFNKIGALGNIEEATEATYYEEGDELPEGKEIGDIKTPASDAIPHTVKSYIDTKIAELAAQLRSEIPSIWKGTEDEYSALSTYENGTVYFIKPNPEQNSQQNT